MAAAPSSRTSGGSPLFFLTPKSTPPVNADWQNHGHNKQDTPENNDSSVIRSHSTGAEQAAMTPRASRRADALESAREVAQPFPDGQTCAAASHTASKSHHNPPACTLCSAFRHRLGVQLLHYGGRRLLSPWYLDPMMKVGRWQIKPLLSDEQVGHRHHQLICTSHGTVGPLPAVSALSTTALVAHLASVDLINL